MPKALAICVVFSMLASIPLWSQDASGYQPFSPQEMDNLLAPIALYPDPLLAQVLPAATFPDQIDESARFIRAGASVDSIDVQPWDVSVKAVAHYPSVLYMMADRLDWTTALGQAYVNQGDDVMATVQRLRQEAQNAGNLVSNQEEEVVTDNGMIDIWPAQPNYCYVPVYDPSIVYFGSYGGPVITFGPALPIGVWLIYDFDWHHRRIFYHGWSTGTGWVARSHSFIHVNNIYVNNNYRNVVVNRAVVQRPVNHNNLARYSSLHQNMPANPRAGGEPQRNFNNKVVQRNMNVNDPRMDAYRGHTEAPPAAVRQSPAPVQPVQRMAPPVRETQPPARVAERPGAFGENRSNFGTQAASERGQSSRASRPAPAPAPRPSGGGSGGGSHGGGGGGGSHGSGGGGHH